MRNLSARFVTIQLVPEMPTYWFELLVEAEKVEEALLADLIQEADELMAIMTSIVKNTKRKQRK